MLRSALALLSSLQVGLRIKESIERSVRQAVVIAIALVILIVAPLFGLVAVYQLLIAHYGFTPAEAAGIVAGPLFLLFDAGARHPSPLRARGRSAKRRA